MLFVGNLTLLRIGGVYHDICDGSISGNDRLLTAHPDALKIRGIQTDATNADALVTFSLMPFLLLMFTKPPSKINRKKDIKTQLFKKTF